MFKIVENRRAWWPVTWPGVTEEGEVIENRIELRFILLDVDAAFEMLREARDMKDGAQAEGRFTLSGQPAKPKTTEPVQLSELYAATIEKVACDWRGVGAENGEPLPWARDNLIRLLKVSGVFDAIIVAYRACMQGGSEIRAGN